MKRLLYSVPVALVVAITAVPHENVLAEEGDTNHVGKRVRTVFFAE